MNNVNGQAQQNPVTGISSMATRKILAELCEAYERSSGQRVVIESLGGVEAARRVQNNEPFDFVVLAADAMDRLAGGGKIMQGSRVDLARSGMAIAVAEGAARPNIGSSKAVRDAILAARSIGYSTGPSGSHLTSLFEQWGIAQTIATHIVQAPPGVPVGTLVARGDVELGFQQLSELMHLPGIKVIGPLPADIQLLTTFAAGICTTSQRPDAAKRLLSFLAAADAASTKLAHGMEPA